MLVIDRLALVRRALRAMLGARDVLAAPDVEAALLVAGRRRPDAVVVGPGQAATAAAEIVRRLHEALPRVPVVVITARSETRWLSDRVHGIGAECVREDAPAGELARVLRRVAGGGAAASGGLSARELRSAIPTPRSPRGSRSRCAPSRAIAPRCCASSASPPAPGWCGRRSIWSS